MTLLPRPPRRGQSTSPILNALSGLYEAPTWALFSEVRSTTSPHEVLRVADAFAVHTLEPRWRIHGFEVKTRRGDWLREKDDPGKSGPLRLFCASWWLVVPAPWKHVVLTLRELPDLWGLIEVGTGGARVVSAAPERAAEEPTIDFLHALLRAAARGEADRDVKPSNVPTVEITRPGLSRDRVGLACGHSAVRPLAKVAPRAAPCWSCAEGRPTDREMVEAAIRDATAGEREGFAALLGAAPARAANEGA